MTTYHLAFAPPGPLLNLNDSRGESRYARIRHQQRVALWRSGAFYYASDAVNRKLIPRGLGFSTISIDLPVVSMLARRDAHNFTATLKAAIDGIVTAGVFADDSTQYLATREPTFHDRREDPLVHVWIDVG